MKIEKKIARIKEKQRKMERKIEKNRKEALKFLRKICKLGWEIDNGTVGNKLIQIGEQIDKALSK